MKGKMAISEAEKNEAINFESSALHGLRGFIAVHLLIFHSLVLSSWGFITYGNVSTIVWYFGESMLS